MISSSFFFKRILQQCTNFYSLTLLQSRFLSQIIIGSLFLTYKPYQNCILIFLFIFIFMCVRFSKKILKSWTLLVLTNRFICLPITKHNCGRIINSYRIFFCKFKTLTIADEIQISYYILKKLNATVWETAINVLHKCFKFTKLVQQFFDANQQNKLILLYFVNESAVSNFPK